MPIPRIPEGTPKPWIIDRIKKDKEKEEGDREQPSVEITEDIELPTDAIEDSGTEEWSDEHDNTFDDTI